MGVLDQMKDNGKMAEIDLTVMFGGMLTPQQEVYLELYGFKGIKRQYKRNKKALDKKYKKLVKELKKSHKGGK